MSGQAGNFGHMRRLMSMLTASLRTHCWQLQQEGGARSCATWAVWASCRQAEWGDTLSMGTPSANWLHST